MTLAHPPPPRPARRRIGRTLRWAAVAVAPAACARPGVPPPEAAVARWASAAARGDADAMYSLLDADSRRRFGRDGARARVGEARREIAEQAHAAAGPRARAVVRATITWPEGRSVEVVVEGGAPRLASPGLRPSAAPTPAAALAELRRALEGVDWSAVAGVLGARAREAWLAERRALLEGLAEPHALDVRVDGRRASVIVPGGFIVRLVHEDAGWRVEAVE
ncbi:MAG: hypothetical protein IT376_17270 [Polyangiaceae bacterium]|nr:hypothetical protein [Polyangiaceae bacterium]